MILLALVAAATYTEVAGIALAAVLSSSVLTVLIQNFFNRRGVEAVTQHTDAETADIIVGASEKAINLVMAQLTAATARIAHLETLLAEANKGIRNANLRIAHLEAELLRRRKSDREPGAHTRWNDLAEQNRQEGSE